MIYPAFTRHRVCSRRADLLAPAVHHKCLVLSFAFSGSVYEELAKTTSSHFLTKAALIKSIRTLKKGAGIKTDFVSLGYDE